MNARTVSFFVPGHPITQGSKAPGPVINGHSTMREDAKSLKAWRYTVSMHALAVRQHPPWDGPVKMELRFQLEPPQRIPSARHGWPCIKPDLDKLTRAIGDACTNIVYVDDGQICVSTQVKEYARQPGVMVTLSRIEENAP